MNRRIAQFTCAIGIAAPIQLAAQNAVARVEIMPRSARMTVGDSMRFTARALDAEGREVQAVISFAPAAAEGAQAARGTLGIACSAADGWVRATKAGDFSLVATVRGGSRVSVRAAVSVQLPPITRVAIDDTRTRLFVGEVLEHVVLASDAKGNSWPDAAVVWTSSDPAVASINARGEVTALKPGQVTITARSGDARSSVRRAVIASPVRRIEVNASASSGRTGDVIHVSAKAFDAVGREVRDAPVAFSLIALVEDTVIAQSPAAEVDQKGRFVAQKAGRYTVLATSPGAVGRRDLEIRTRDAGQRVTVVGRAPLLDKMTTDLYVWQGKDGRDYMITGTFNAGGQAYFYDVTDPANQVLLDSVVVDARTVNDVYVDDTGTICIIAREGASNRRNGIVLIDCSDPRRPKIITSFEDGLTGGVHNVNYWNKRVFAISNTTRFDIINIENPAKPFREGVVELDTPGHAIHDVWVVDGLAYSSWWKDGVVVTDVGNGKYGGTPSKPVHVGSYKYPLGATHAAYPYKSATGKFYLIVGDELFPYGVSFVPTVSAASAPPRAAGYAHIIDFTDPKRPEEVARYEVPEAGSHNFWIEGDRLYASFYNGGLRVVDISGELKGNLYYQGREIASFLPFDPKGLIPNAPFTTGPQLYKGNIFFADAFTGIWTVRLEPRSRPVP